jgi:membrane protein implicated in regulation of membrane protease activity
MLTTCTETVSILYAIAFGAGDACVDVSAVSILTAFAAFMVLVVIAQFLARKLWARLTQPQPHVSPEPILPENGHPFSDDPNYRDSAIRSSKR